MRIAHESIWVYDFTTLPPLMWSPHLRCTAASGALHRGFYNPSTAKGGPPPLTQGRRWRVPLNEVCANFDRLPCVRGAVSKAD